MALTNENGDNETNIRLSQSLGFTIYDANTNEIKVKNISKPLDIWIAREESVIFEQFKYVNVLNATAYPNSTSLYLNEGQLINGFYVNGFNLTSANVSIHIQIKPNNTQVVYLSLLKFGINPSFLPNKLVYDILNIHCPSDLISEQNDLFYLIFENMSNVYRFKTLNSYYVGLSLIELPIEQIDCANKSLNTIETLLNITQNLTSHSNQTSFTDNFWLRIYLSGCYYTNETSYAWSSYGMEIMSDSNITHTHCQSNHLTTFAGGFIVLPPAINFNYVWANASFVQNPVIYSTAIALVCFYILLGVWSRWMDVKDGRKVGFSILGDFKKEENKYLYEIIVFTGSRPNAGTKSNVNFYIKFYFLIFFLCTFLESMCKNNKIE